MPHRRCSIAPTCPAAGSEQALAPWQTRAPGAASGSAVCINTQTQEIPRATRTEPAGLQNSAPTGKRSSSPVCEAGGFCEVVSGAQLPAPRWHRSPGQEVPLHRPRCRDKRAGRAKLSHRWPSCWVPSIGALSTGHSCGLEADAPCTNTWCFRFLTSSKRRRKALWGHLLLLNSHWVPAAPLSAPRPPGTLGPSPHLRPRYTRSEFTKKWQRKIWKLLLKDASKHSTK